MGGLGRHVLPAAKSALAILCLDGGRLRGDRPARHAHAALFRSRQHRHAVPAGRGAGGGQIRPRAGGAGVFSQRRVVRLFLRVAALFIFRQRHPVPAHFCRDAGRGADHRPPHRQPALPGARGIAPRTAFPRPVRTGTRPVRGIAAGADHRDQQQGDQGHFRHPCRHPAAGRTRQAPAPVRRTRFGSRLA